MTSEKSSFSYQRYEHIPSEDINLKSSRKFSRPQLLGFFLTFLGTLILLLYGGLLRSPSMLDATGNSTPFKSVAHPDTPTIYWGVVKKPYPTGAFWTNLVVDNGDGVVGLYPYGIKTVNTGVQVSYGAFRRLVSHQAISDYFNIDLEISSVESYQSRAVSDHSNLSVSMTYQVVGGSFTTHLVKSCPFVTVIYQGATPVIRSDLMLIQSVEMRATVNSTGVQYLVTLGNFEKWLVYCSDPAGLQWQGNALIGATPINGFVRVAILPLQNAEASFDLLMGFVNRYPTGGSLLLSSGGDSLDQTTATVEYQYTSEGSGDLLMLALPHHVALLQSPSLSDVRHTQAAEVYTPLYCIKGRMRPVIGDSWLLVYPLVSVGWEYVMSEALTTSQLNVIATNLMLDVNTIQPNAEDPYTFGKQSARMAAIALMSDNLGMLDVRLTALNNLQLSMIPWIEDNSPDLLLYDVTYGGVVSHNGITSPQADFGSGWYNDHHFHYGYFTYSAAVLAKLAPAFFNQYKSFFDALLHDYCHVGGGGGTTAEFPFVRHKDFFDGHSWASGLFQLANGKGQESSSEAVNAYYAAYLYGLATNDVTLSSTARLLLSMEIHSTKYYWHMQTVDTAVTTDSSELIYDNIFAATYMVGNVGATDVTTTTWFGNDLKYVHGINMMPLTPVTTVLFDAAFVRNQYPVLATSVTNFSLPGKECSANYFCQGLQGDCCPTAQLNYLACCDGSEANQVQVEFTSYVYVDLAVIDRDLAWQKILTLTTFGDGNSRSNSLYWAATRAPKSVTPSQLELARNVSDYAAEVLPSCGANSACDVLGLQGLCCPTAGGVFLGCCPNLH